MGFIGSFRCLTSALSMLIEVKASLSEFSSSLVIGFHLMLPIDLHGRRCMEVISLSFAILIVNGSVHVPLLVDFFLLASGCSWFLTSVLFLLCCFPSARALARDWPFDSAVSSESSVLLSFPVFVLVSA